MKERKKRKKKGRKQHLVLFLIYSEMPVENRHFYLSDLYYLAPPLGVTPLEFHPDLWLSEKTVVYRLSFSIDCRHCPMKIHSFEHNTWIRRIKSLYHYIVSIPLAV